MSERMDGKKLVKGKGGWRMITIDPSFKSAFEIEEPPWDDDSKFQFCSKCMKKFSFTARRHHCRRCGKICCSDCCCQKLALPRLCFVDPERVCKDCIPVVKAENLFFSKHLKILLDGAQFLVQDDNTYLQCYLNPKSKQELQFKGIDENATENPVVLNSIVGTGQLTETTEGNEKLVGIILKLKDNIGERRVKITVKHGSPNAEKSFAFLDSLQQAVKLMHDSN